MTATDTILIGINDPQLAEEATTIAAATGHPTHIATGAAELLRNLPQAHALIVDRDNADLLSHHTHTTPLFYVTADPDPPDYHHALTLHARGAYQLPSDNRQLLTDIGALNHRNHQQATIIAVTGGHGGAGTTTLACALARAHATKGPVTLIDTDPTSGGIDLTLGLENTPGARWEDLYDLGSTPNPTTLLRALPTTKDHIHLLTHTRSNTPQPDPPNPTPNLIAALSHTPTTTVLDLSTPTRTADEHLTLATHTVLITAAEIRALAATTVQLAHLNTRIDHQPHIILRHRHWSSITTSDAENILGRPITATIPTSIRLAKAIELGGLPTKLPKHLNTLAHTITATP
ncbi:septum site-determining protein Ssd [Corynebacterium aquilae]|uniref:Uncharacterized protein n=1 Tax=Corynebacterium aquilae DSM 44791 TaxID=1431546 RepID=A0A1L7CDH3_9CORY|nr:septum site-determining protein Ssd [Corynebacterium aquilae]APT83876.1 hypothetical protein CAQU_00915 [Corynebacterium aquilae DSM 44791]